MNDRKYLLWLIIESCDNDDGGLSKHCEAGLAELEDGAIKYFAKPGYYVSGDRMPKRGYERYQEVSLFD